MTSATWKDLLSPMAGLSDRFRARHAILLAGLTRNATESDLASAVTLAATNPRHAERVLLGLGTHPIHDHSPDAAMPVTRIEGDQVVANAVRDLLADQPCIECLLAGQPALEQTWVPLHPSRRATSVPSSSVGPLVALRWSAASVAERATHQDAVDRLIAAANTAVGPDGLTISAPRDYAVAWSSDRRDPWVFSPNLGTTLEDELRGSRLTPSRRARVIEALAGLRKAMIDLRLVWQGFAPRNMFLDGSQILLIDFEDTTDSDADAVRAAGQLLWHRVFFADCLTPTEHAALFDCPTAPVPTEDQMLPADPFERALLGADQVTWAQRRDLLHQSIRLEGRHQRPTGERDSGILFGHELGHFWGDFLADEQEAVIFRRLTTMTDDIELVACLEMFEAAMEADIGRMLRDAAAGRPTVACPRTEALTAVLADAGPVALVEARAATPTWYRDLSESPADLVDHSLFTLRTGNRDSDRATMSSHLVGADESRKQHTESLTRAIESGLAFMHADDRGDMFLRYVRPEEIRDSLAEPLPLEGGEMDDVFSAVEERIARYSISQSHPGYLAFPDAGNAVAALAGSVMAPLLNQNLIAVDRSAPAATFATVQVVEWLRELIGYTAASLSELHGVRDVAGLWTTGGHLSNHIAMLTALGDAFPQAREDGLRALDTQPGVVMAGPIAHYSHSDSAFHLGLGWNAVLTVSASSDHTTDPAAVDAVLSNPPGGVTPFMVVGVAGNCRTTGLDDLSALADVCERHGVWFHVDACHGGSLIFNEHLKARHLAGIERADSVSLDPHKGLFTPYPSSYVVFRERGMLTHFSRHTEMVNQDGCWDLGLITPFLGSGGFEALPTWMLLKHVGVRQLGAMVDARQALVRHLERRLDEADLFVSLNDVDFYRLAFVFCPPAVRARLATVDGVSRRAAIELLSHYTSRLNTLLYQDGRVCFDEHTLVDLGNRVGLGADAKYTVMACCPGNPLTTAADLDRAVGLLTEAARPLAQRMLSHLDSNEVLSGARRMSGPASWDDQ